MARAFSRTRLSALGVGADLLSSDALLAGGAAIAAPFAPDTVVACLAQHAWKQWPLIALSGCSGYHLLQAHSDLAPNP